VCGCDGAFYLGECRARVAGTDIGDGCQPPLDTFACGPQFCASYTEYCDHVRSDIVGWPDDYACRPYPPACAAMGHPSCACLVQELGYGECTGEFPDLTVTTGGG
jgi:hypothetical protein